MKLKVLTILMGVLLTGCGGGGEDWASQDPSAKAISPNNFDMDAAWSNFNLSPNSKELYLSGSCTGKLIISNTRPSSTGTAGTVFNYTNINRYYQTCNAPFASLTSATSAVTYYNITNYYTLSNNRLKNFQYNYSTTVNVWRTLPNFPTAAKVGDAGLIGVIDNYTNSARTTKSGVEEWRYVIEEDTASSAVLNLIVKAYGTTTSTTDTDYLSASVIQTEQYRYVVGPGTPTLILRTYDIEKSSGFRLHAQ